MEEETFNWNTIESDPGVFNEMVKNLGCDDIQFKEIFSFDDSATFERIKPIKGFILLFEYNKQAINYIRNEYSFIETNEYPDIFFAEQVVQNACATQAILSTLMNIPNINLGPTLQQFKNQTLPLNPHERGLAIGNNEIIRKTHNDFAQPSEILEHKISKKLKGVEGRAYHFISIIPYNGILLLLDGLSEGPIIIGGADENWPITGMKPFFEGLISAMQGSLEFTLLAVVQDQIKKYQELYENAIAEKNEYQIEIYKDIIDEEKKIKEQQHKENKRRKHDYMPLALNLILFLGKHHKLEQEVEKQINEITKK
ncbi:ubiquitin carboxyl-terminal hydrolase isozyme L5, putative [Entamoeba dispar SAW760]|uniref:Ubiquitin carboxyl-terminal hydrolase n=1 Tax=Entamoeba dispar (strain ATCC PRA-260 / SAW760) TaxID=370354 RepID=B0ESJ2_ENTDS|nr:ubiquitin carboxyl-terminal hydrolase isozyme L5, putative [Entamoeba dispar SAW760]EDR22486.1 ubiquitin carboxyl-terminal hydrolase isozyme L5, putative [Entamoeba dispar SAW760]|eukprot:EDR22486.1 ubiquitin carboxyl-terminal hydrolase isozyme L5, putative [Entamoeba dispar SAW760]